MRTYTQSFLFIALISILSCVKSPHPVLVIQTGEGEIILEVYPDKAPITANNFLDLVERGVYTDALFYRVVRLDNQPYNDVKIEVIQGGLYESDRIDMHPNIAHETTEVTGIKHTDGVISMARNIPGSASTEIFICIGDQPSLDFGGKRNPDGQGFAAFGKVIKGMDVVRAIQSIPDSNQALIEQVPILEIRMDQ